MYRIALIAPLSLVAACAASVDGSVTPVVNPTVIPTAVNQGLAPTFSRADVAAFNDEALRTAALPRTPVSVLPTGTVRYEGQVGSNLTLDGQAGFGMLGDMRMDVGFSGARQVDGAITDINLLQNGTPVQEFGGSLDIDGDQASGKLRADADGVLTLRDQFGTQARTNMALQLDGVVVDDVFRGDAVDGTVTGFGDGYQLSGPTVNILLDGQGRFTGVVD